ncbi:solute carrier family 45 member 3 [Trichonephila inaurata madagascariensis]|uniref:Solute carrier family 45 member 3 n=1 Tax=Trichonephila inaurata madagascariensis TaxID=2747483 RepID=A0A8X6XJU2_9ARAC|nr:solute carrier family 45 member 3 [Trichonephila inaurata madagascariensis]
MKMEKSCLLPINDSTSSNVTAKCGTIDSVIKKTSINCLKLAGINLLAFGLELCASAGFTYIPPIMLKHGFTDKTLTIVMGIGPFISLMLVPIIGRWSDRCQSRFGRRRPFMLALGIIMIFSLLIIPFNREICTYAGFLNPSFGLAVGVILLDFSSQALMNPCKALIPDIFHSLEEQSSGFTVYSCMLSLGGCFGYFITSFNWTSTSVGNYFGGQEKAVFSLLALMLFILLAVNLSIAREKPLYLSGGSFDKNFNDFKLIKDSEFNFDTNNKILPSTKVSKVMNSFKCHVGTSAFKTDKNMCNAFAQSPNHLPDSSFQKLHEEHQGLIYSWLFEARTMFRNSFKDFFSMPPVLFRLFIACLFGWMGIMCHDMYYTDFVGQVIYKGNPQAYKESVAFVLYDDGVRMGSWGLLLHCLSAAIYAAFLQEKLIIKYGKSRTYLFGMICFTFSLLGTVMSSNIILVNTFSAISGLGSAAITTVPYSLITEYYSKKEVYYDSSRHRGVGEDMAVLDSAVYLSQIIPSLFLGYIVEYTKTSTTYMLVTAFCGVAACYFSYFVTFTS